MLELCTRKSALNNLGKTIKKLSLNEKTIVLFAALFVAQFTMAKDYVLVVKGNNNSVKSNIEVKSDNGDIDKTGTITVKSGSDVTTITVTVKDIYGAVLLQDAVPASEDGTYVLTIPELSNGTILEIKDNTGIVYLYINKIL